MASLKTELRQIENNFIKGFVCEIASLFILNLNTTSFSSLSTTVKGIFSAIAIVLFLFGYFICWRTAYKYGKYKGYPNYLGLIAGATNLFGVSFLFLLDSRRVVSFNFIKQHPLNRFSIFDIFVAYVAISIVFFPIIIIAVVLVTNASVDEVSSYFSNADFASIYSLPFSVAISWYLLKKVKVSQLSWAQIFGSLFPANYLVPIVLATAQYLFVSSLNSIVLYRLSFTFPDYVINQINQDYPITSVGWIAYSISALIVAPIVEEIFFRGIVFQKLGLNKNIQQGLLLSAILFAVVHFRFDFLSLCLGGIILGTLYYRTKQLATAIVCHFVYNAIVIGRLLYSHFVINYNGISTITIAEYQQQFIHNLNATIVLMAVSMPYLLYFIYKYFPRYSAPQKLPYFANEIEKKSYQQYKTFVR